MNFWLLKSEPGNYSIDDFAREKATDWTGVRNYQARNFMKEMEVGDLALFYHSNAEPPGVTGIAKITSLAKPDRFQFDRKSPYYDAKATRDSPIWFCPDIAFVEKFDDIVSLSALRASAKLKEMGVLQKGSRLSVLPVSKAHFSEVLRMAGARSKV